MKTLTLRSIIVFVLKLLLAAAIFYWLISAGHLDFKIIPRLFSSYNFIPIFLVMFFMFSISFYRLYYLLQLKKNVLGVTFSFKQVVKASAIGLFFNFTLPGGVGGDIVKIFYLTKNKGTKKTQLLKIAFYDRLIGLASLLGLAFVAFALYKQKLPVNDFIEPFVLSVTLLFLALMIFLFYGYRRRLFGLFYALALSLVAHLLIVCIFYLSAQSFGYSSLQFAECLLLVPLGMAMTALPITPAGIGVGQVAFFYIFRFYFGESSEMGPTLMTTFHLLQFMFSLVGLYFYMTYRKEAPIFKNCANEV